MTTKELTKELRKELRQAYIALGRANRNDENECQRTIGRYYGMRRAYSIATGLPEDIIGQQVVSWYVRSKHYTPSS